MISDEERREVARRLRYWTDDASNTIRDIPGAWTILRIEAGAKTWREVYLHLADLIEPSIPADPGEAGLACVDAFIREHTEKPVDRDALLELAREMKFKAKESEAYFAGVYPGEVVEYADRIREALGVDDA